MALQKLSKIICFILIAVCVACDNNKEYDSYQSIGNDSWGIENPKVFNVDIDEIDTERNLFLNIRTNSEYPYKNIYIISKMILPNGIVIKDTLEYEMADVYGNWLGDGFTEVKNNKLYFLEKYKFPTNGAYRFEFSQAMRKRGEIKGVENLAGVTDVGFRIEKIQD